MKTLLSAPIAFAAFFVPALAVAQASVDPATGPAVTAPPQGAPSATVIAAPTAADQPAAPASSGPADPNSRRGFLLRMHLGAGYRSASTSGTGPSMMASGRGAGVSILAGGAVARNLFVYGEFLTEHTSNPTLEFGQTKAVANQATMSLSGFGPGIMYWMPYGVHVGGTFLLTNLKIEKDGVEQGSTDLGYGFSARLGRDFWLHRHWALGVVGQFTVASMRDKESSPTHPAATFTATAFTVGLAGSYN